MYLLINSDLRILFDVQVEKLRSLIFLEIVNFLFFLKLEMG